MTLTDYLTTLSPKNQKITKEIMKITKRIDSHIKPVIRFSYLFFDLNGWLFYVGMQTKDRKKDTLTISFCQGAVVSKQNPALELLWQGQKEGLAMIRKLKIDSLQELETYHFTELLEIMVIYNKEHNTHQERVKKRHSRKNTR